MKHFILFFLFIQLVSFSYAQETVYAGAIELDQVLYGQNKVLPITNGQTNEVALFLVSKTKIRSLLFSDKMEKKAEHVFARRWETNYEPVGYSISENKYHLFFSDWKRENFFIKTIDPVTGRHSKLKFDVEGGKVIETFNNNGKFYTLSINEFDSSLTLNEYSGAESQYTQKVKIPNNVFPGYPKRLYEYLYPPKEIGETIRAHIRVVDGKVNPRPLSPVAIQNKLYVFDDKIVISIDDIDQGTSLLSIDLISGIAKRTAFPAQLACSGNNETAANSFLSEEYLYRISACESIISLQIMDAKTRKLVHTEKSEGDKISFASTNVTEFRGTDFFSINNEKEIKKSKNYLKKFSSHIALSAFEMGEDIELTIGSYEQANEGIGGWETYTYTLQDQYGRSSDQQSGSYYNKDSPAPVNQYAQSTFFKSNFDNRNLSFTQNKSTSFDKLIAYVKSKKRVNKSVETIFEFDGHLYWGYYDVKKKTYNLIKV